MRHFINLLFCLSVLFFISAGCAHMGDPCDNELIEQVTSPDGSHVVSIYDRKCSTKLYTYAALEKPRNFGERRGEVVCHLLTWGGKHPTEVEWTDSQNIFISTTDALTDLELAGEQTEICGKNIRITYSIPGYPRPEPTVQNESPPDRIRLVLSKLGPCLEKFPGNLDSSKSIVHDIENYLKKGPHSMAVNLIVQFSDYGKCEMSGETREELVRLSKLYNVRPPAPEPDTLTIVR